MKPNNARKGMKVECQVNNYPESYSKGDTLTISEVRVIEKTKGALKFEEYPHWWNIVHFEPVNKLEVGDEVLFDGKEKCKIIFIADKPDRMDNRYAVDFEGEEESYYEFLSEKTLSPLKNKDDLDVGDKFKVKSGTVYEILSVGYDDFYNDVDYYIKEIKGSRVGRTETILSKNIDEIIYN